MARKKLLSESEIRQFMKLANIKPLQEMGGYMSGMRDEEEDALIRMVAPMLGINDRDSNLARKRVEAAG